jgi:endoglucanase
MKKGHLIIFLFMVLLSWTVWGSDLIEQKVVDKDYLMIHFKDGDVVFDEDGGPSDGSGGSHAVYYGTALDKTNAAVAGNWLIKSGDDPMYGASGVSPVAVYRKTKVNGMDEDEWGSGDWNWEYTYEHFIYLGLPSSLQQGSSYTIEFPGNINSSTTSASFTFDIFHCHSEAVHTNLVGYVTGSSVKSADLYHFMGDGGYRDYTDFIGNDVYIYNVSTGKSEIVGSVAFWMEGKQETHWNMTGGDVWTIDFTGFDEPGTYRLAVEGVGCSEDFHIDDGVYYDPYKVSVQGYFYMRIGQEEYPAGKPEPRTPLYIPDVSPSDCRVYVTSMHPYHSDWDSFSSGDQWDKPDDWASYALAGNLTNPNATGGHSDAADWDRHLAHVANIYDLCLAYILSEGTLGDDDLNIAESGNGIPDILDEARNEVDFWLNLRYDGGYSHGVTCPNDSNALYQAGNTAVAAWANALNCSMLAYCFQIAGLDSLRNTYEAATIEAYNYAGNLSDQMLDEESAGIRGRDFKMMAAAYLYNVTGDTQYEDEVNNLSVVDSPTASIWRQNSFNQIWGVAAYVTTQQPVHYPDLQNNMRAAIITQAKSVEADMVNSRPSRRGYADEDAQMSGNQAWWQTNQDMPRTIIAHAISKNQIEKDTFLDALLMEADWGLGRNPLNLIQMTTATTPLEDKRSFVSIYTSGRDDGSPGLHPGHTPYLNTESWGSGMIGNDPTPVFNLFYPDISNWPHSSKWIDTRYIWCHTEFTPRQTMRGKTLLYGYLYGLTADRLTASFTFSPGTPLTGQNISFDASGSTSPDKSITDYSWTFGDGATGSGATPIHSYSEAGSYLVALTVTDTNANKDTETKTVIVYTGDPIASFTFSPNKPLPGEVVTFDASASTDVDGSITSYSWDFGDGSTDSGMTVNHSYSEEGTYSVTLTVSDDNGNIGSENRDVTAALPKGLEVWYLCSETGTSTNTIRGSLDIRYTTLGSESIPLDEITMRYWYTNEGSDAISQQFNCFYAQIGSGNVSGAFYAVDPPVQGADMYMEIIFDSGAGILSPGEQTGEIQFSVNNNDWSSYDQSDDYSFDGSASSYTKMEFITLYRNSVLIWGSEPGEVSTPTQTPTEPTTPTPTTPASEPGDVNSDGTVDIVDALLSAQYYVGLNPANFNAANGDVNCDGNVDIVDALLIAQYYVGLITDFC